MTTENETNQPSREPTAEEIRVMHKNMIDYYKNQNSVLKHQVEYEENLMRVEESRLRRALAIVKYSQLTAPQPKESIAPVADPVTTTS